MLACIGERGAAPLRPGWIALPSPVAYVVTQSSGDASALHKDDRILSVAGDTGARVYGPAFAMAQVPRNSNYEVEVRRPGRGNVTVSLRLGSGGPPDWYSFIPDLIAAFLLFAVGSWIAVAKPGDKTARLAAATFVLSSVAMMEPVLRLFPGWNLPSASIALMLGAIWRPWHLTAAYSFLSRFPKPTPEGPIVRFTRYALYSAAFLLWAPANLSILAQISGVAPNDFVSALLPFRPDRQPGAMIHAAFDSAASGAMCLLLLRNYQRLPDLDSRRRIRWAGLGFGSALLVFVTLSLTRFSLYVTGNPLLAELYPILNSTGIVLVALAPVTLGYAVVKHRVLGIHVAARRGVQYVLAKNVLRLLVLMPILILLAAVIRRPELSLSEVMLSSSWSFNVAVVATGIISLRFRRQLSSWLDRKFFRQDFDQEQILLGLIERIKTAEWEQDVCTLVAREIELALHVDGFHIVLRDHRDGRLCVAYSHFPERAALFRDYLNQQTAVLAPSEQVVTLSESNEDSTSNTEASGSYRENLILPLSDATGSNIGMLVFGPKRSEEPYSNRDRDLLKAIAGQMSVMLEVLRLRQRIHDESRVRVEVLGHLDRHRIELLSECPDCGRCYSAADQKCADDGANLSLTLPVEKTIDGKYRLERRLGRGGMGVVYEASDLRLGRLVAIKIMIGQLFGNAAAVSRFEREARATALLDHKNIVRVHDLGRLATGGAYIVMELVRGKSWREHLRELGSLRPETASNWMSQLCLAISAAHAKDIVHRDLKPENVIVAPDPDGGRVVVLDFGIAKVRTEFDPEMTMAGTVLGTRGYMSPEQRSGLRTDGRTDLYAIGVICTESLSGNRPPKNGASLEWMRMALGRVTSPDSPLATLLERALADNPADRFARVFELAEALPDAIFKSVTGVSPLRQHTDPDASTIGPDATGGV